MTMVDQQRRVGRMDVRVVFGTYMDYAGLHDLVTTLNQMEDLLIMAQLTTGREGTIYMPAALDDATMRVRKSVDVKTVHYGSPLEIVFSIMLGTGFVTASGTALLNLHDRFLQSRVARARTNAVTAAYDVLTEAVKREESLDPTEYREFNQRTESASIALAQIDNVEVLEG